MMTASNQALLVTWRKKKIHKNEQTGKKKDELGSFTVLEDEPRDPLVELGRVSQLCLLFLVPVHHHHLFLFLLGEAGRELFQPGLP